VRLEVYLDGRLVEAESPEEVIRKAMDAFLKDLASEDSRHDLATVLAFAVRQEFLSRDMVWTGRLTTDIAIEGDRAVFYAPHAWKFASGYHRTAKKQKNGLWHAAGSRDVTLTAWVKDKAPHLDRGNRFKIRIPEDHGFKKDAYTEAADKRAEEILDAWVAIRIRKNKGFRV